MHTDIESAESGFPWFTRTSPRRRTTLLAALFLVLSTAFPAVPANAQGTPEISRGTEGDAEDVPLENGSQALTETSPLAVEETLVAGGPGDFLEARHLKLRGTNFQIGRKLAELARDRYGFRPRPDSPTPHRTAQRKYMERNFPIYAERMRGAASLFGLALNEDRADFDGISYLLEESPGCSVVYYPPSATRDRVGYLSRNFDFSTGTIRGQRPAPGQLPCTARPYIVELHPDRGHSSLYLCSYDLLGGTLDGINSEGLCVALLADDELNQKFPMEPTASPSVGLGVLHVGRLLLDTCASVAEAKEALLLNKQFYRSIPCHYIIADRYGDSFVWEYSHAHNKEYIVEGAGKHQITTNFSLHRYPVLDQLPKESHPMGSFNRYRTLQREIARMEETTPESVKQVNRCVSPAGGQPSNTGRPLGRTLWHSLYCPEKRSLEVDFYLGDEVDRETGQSRIRRSGSLSFSLDPN